MNCDLMATRYSHACVAYLKDDQSPMIMVVGGIDNQGNAVLETEVLDLRFRKWNPGPKLPTGKLMANFLCNN